jgi:integrase
MRGKLTRRLLDSPRATEAGEVWDAGPGACSGFYARHRGLDGSRWRYALKYRRAGAVRHHAIAEDGAAIPAEACDRLGLTPGAKWTPEAARREAERVRGIVRQGQDPDAGRGVPTLRAFAARFRAEHLVEPLRKARTIEEYGGLIDRHLLPALGDFRLDRLDQAAVTRLARDLKEKPVTANRALAVLSSMYGRAAAWGLVPAGMNPTRGVPRFRESRRERFLSAEELARLGAALRELEAERAVSPYALAAVRLLLFTGARPGEITSLRWQHADLGRGVLNLPDSKTGQKTIYLSPPALQVLAALPRIDGEPRVFPPYKRAAAEADLESAWRRLRKRAGLEGVRLYDASRHGFASMAVSGGASLYLVGGLLGHRKPGTTARYSHLSADPLRAVNDAVGAALTAALGDKVPRRNVATMRRGRR